MVLAFFKWGEASALGKGISGSVYLFPVVEAVHLLALAVIGGAVLIVDMRLAGSGTEEGVGGGGGQGGRAVADREPQRHARSPDSC